MKLNKNLILTAVSLIGLGATGYFAYKAGKSDSTDKKKFIPTVIAGTITAGCIVCNYHLSMRDRAQLLTSLGVLGKVAKDYQEVVEKEFPEKAHTILKQVQKENPEWIETVKAHNISGSSSLSSHGVNIPEGGDFTFCLKMCGKEHWFRSTMFNIVAAEMHLNRNIQLGVCASTDDLVDFLGLDTDIFDGYIWDMDQLYDELGVCWLDLDTNYYDQEKTYYVLYPNVEPIKADEYCVA